MYEIHLIHIYIYIYIYIYVTVINKLQSMNVLINRMHVLQCKCIINV